MERIKVVVYLSELHAIIEQIKEGKVTEARNKIREIANNPNRRFQMGIGEVKAKVLFSCIRGEE